MSNSRTPRSYRFSPEILALSRSRSQPGPIVDDTFCPPQRTTTRDSVLKRPLLVDKRPVPWLQRQSSFTWAVGGPRCESH